MHLVFHRLEGNTIKVQVLWEFYILCYLLFFSLGIETLEAKDQNLRGFDDVELLQSSQPRTFLALKEIIHQS